MSAQNRQRLYWTNIPGVQQPEDRGILLRDVLDDAVAWQNKSYCLTATEYKGTSVHHNLTHRNRTLVAEHADSFAMRQVGRRINEQGHRDDYNENLAHVQRYEVNEDPQKTNCLTTVQKDNMVAVSADGAMCVASRGRYTREDGGAEQHLEVQTSGKTNALTTVQKDNLVAQPLELREPETSVDVDNYRFESGEHSGRNAVQFLGAFSKEGERWLEDGKSYSRNFNQGRRLHGVNQNLQLRQAETAVRNVICFILPMLQDHDLIPLLVKQGDILIQYFPVARNADLRQFAAQSLVVSGCSSSVSRRRISRIFTSFIFL